MGLRHNDEIVGRYDEQTTNNSGEMLTNFCKQWKW